MKKKLKRWVGLLLTVVMVVTSVRFYNSQVEAASTSSVTYESLSDTVDSDSVTVPANEGAKLGAVTNLQDYFMVKVSTSATSYADLRLGLYNTVSGSDVWADTGYILMVRPFADGHYEFWLMNDGETALAYKNGEAYSISGLGSYDYITITTWLTNIDEEAGTHTIHIAVDGTEIMSYPNDGSLAIGKNMCAHSSSEDRELLSVFEDVSDLMGQESLTVGANGSSKIGTVSGLEKGFRFRVNRPDASTTGTLKIGLYNIAENNVNERGYRLYLSPSTTEGQLNWSVKGVTETGDFETNELDQGVVEGLTGDTVDVHVWRTQVIVPSGREEAHVDYIIHIAIAGQEVFTFERNWDTYGHWYLYCGKYMNVSNELNVDTIFSDATVEEYREPRVGVTYESLSDTVGAESVTVAANGSATLGTVTNVQDYFMLKVQTSTVPYTDLFLGLYNTTTISDVWQGSGYVFVVRAISEGNYGFRLADNKGNALVYADSQEYKISGLGSYNYITITTWLTDVDETAGTHILHVAVNGTEIMIYKNDGSLATGKNMGATRNGNGSETELLSVFEDVSDITSGTTSVTYANNAEAQIGSVSSLEKGFRFKVNRPATSTTGTLKLGLYNVGGDIWQQGLRLFLTPSTTAGQFDWSIYGTAWVNDNYSGDTWKMAEGTVDKLTNDTFDVHVWRTQVKVPADQSDGQVEYVIHIAIAGQEIFTWTRLFDEGWYTISGLNMCVRNEWSIDAIISDATVEELEQPDVSDETTINATYESLSDTVGADSVTVAVNGSATLGTVTNVQDYFMLKVQTSTASFADLFLGLYNTTAISDVWQGSGYVFVVRAISDGNYGFRLADNKGNELVYADNQEYKISGLGSYNYITITTWLTDVDETAGTHILHVAVNGTEIMIYKNDGSLATGKNMGATRNGNGTETELLSVFEDVSDITSDGTDTVTYGNETGGSIGSLSDVEKGFRFRVNRPGASESLPLKIGLYNDTAKDVWQKGYRLFLTSTGTEGELAWSVRGVLESGDTESYELGNGTIKNLTDDTVDIHVWRTEVKLADGQTVEGQVEYVLHIAINGQEIFAYERLFANGWYATSGNYMCVYNQWSVDAVITDVTLTDPVKRLTYESLVDTVGAESVAVAKNAQATLGAVADVENYFMVKVQTCAVNYTDVKLGLYNINEGSDMWATSGYILTIRSWEDGHYEFWLTSNNEQDYLTDYQDGTGYTISGLASYEYMTITTWLTDVDETARTHTLHIAVDGTEIMSSNNDGTIETGTNMSVARNGNGPEDIELLSVFEDLGETAELNSTTVAQEAGADIGSVSSMEKGFRFKVGYKEQTTDGLLKIGLYNTDNGDPWADGYVLWLQTRETAGMLGWGVHVKGATDTGANVEGYAPAFANATGFAEGDVEFFVWLTEVDETAGTHVFHLAINGIEVATWRNDGSDTNAAGLRPTDVYMSAYNESWNNGATISTFYQPDIDFNINKINDNTAYDTTNSAWKIYLNTDVSIPANTYDWKVSVDDVDYDVTLGKEENNAGTQIYLSIPSSVIPQTPEKHYKVVLKVMTADAEDSRGAYSITLGEAYTLYVQKSGCVLDTALDYVANTNVNGDCNGNQVTSAADLVRLKRYLKGDVLVNSNADLTNTVGDSINEEDVKALRRMLTLSEEEKAVGTAQDVDDYVAYGMPSYLEDEVMRIGAYCGPRTSGENKYSMTWKITSDYIIDKSADVASVTGTEVTTDFVNDYEFEQFKNAGFNTVVAEVDAGQYSAGSSMKQLETYMDLSDKYGLNVILSASTIPGYLTRADGAATEDSVKKELSDLIELVSEHKSFMGIQMGDEIPADSNDAVGTVYKSLSKFIKQDLGRDDLLLYTSNPARDGSSLTTLMTDLGQTNGWYEFSYYPLATRQNTEYFSSMSAEQLNKMTESEAISKVFSSDFLGEEWIGYLSAAAEEAQSQNVHNLGTILQSSGYLRQSNSGHPSRRALASQADVGYQVYTSLAYGAKSLTYFTYWQHFASSTTEYFTDSIVRYPDGDGTQSEKTAAYDWVKAVNEDVLAFDHVIKDFEWKGTINLQDVAGEDSTYTNSRLASATATAATLVGCMKDSEGFDGYMIANATDPEKTTSTEVTLSFNKASKAIVYVNGEKSIVDLTDGTYTVTVGVGEGVFVIPLV